MKPAPIGRRAVLAVAAAAPAALLMACSKQAEAPPAAAPAAAPAATADPAAARQAFEAAGAGSGFTVGQAMSARQARVFFDPQCPHCAALWTASQPLLDRVRMTWMPVAFIAPTSAPQGALLLAAADPKATMDEHEKRLAAGQGGLEVPAQPDEAGAAKVKANTALFQQIGGGGVPYVLYQAGGDGPYGIESGALSTAQLTQRLGL